MKKRTFLSCVAILCLLCTFPVLIHAQDSTSLYSKAFSFPDKFFGAVNTKSEKLQQDLIRSTQKHLKKLSKQERKLQKKLAKKDPAAAKEIFGDVDKRSDSLNNGLSTDPAKLQNLYSPHMDSMQTALHFLQSNKVLDQSPQMQTQLQSVMKDYGNAQGKLNQTHVIQEQLKERQQYLKDKLQNFGLGKEIRKYQEKVYYYRAQVDEYKKTFENPQKLEAKLLQVANKIPAFSKFFNKHSQLAGLFRLPGNDDLAAAGMEGLQTRSMIMQELGQRMGTDPNAQQFMGSSIASAQSHLGKAKDKLNQLGGSGSDMDMPDFKPNNEKSKSFLKRLELGTNIQSAKSNSFLPTTSDLGVSLGYKFSPKAVAGIGASYKMGWGKDIRHLSISHEGVGLRTFGEWKLKGSFWMSAGSEWNYRSQFRAIEELKHYSAWQQSALAGFSKKFKAGKKFKGNIQLLYDFLHNRSVPRAQPLVFRTGYQL